jgi:hypothetical protein
MRRPYEVRRKSAPQPDAVALSNITPLDLAERAVVLNALRAHDGEAAWAELVPAVMEIGKMSWSHASALARAADTGVIVRVRVRDGHRPPPRAAPVAEFGGPVRQGYPDASPGLTGSARGTFGTTRLEATRRRRARLDEEGQPPDALDAPWRHHAEGEKRPPLSRSASQNRSCAERTPVVAGSVLGTPGARDHR